MSDAGPRVRVLIADDHALLRGGLAMILAAEPDIELVAEAADGVEAVARCRELRPDVVLMDVQMPRLDGIEATRQVVAEDLAKVVVLTTFDRDDYLFAALQAGASGFLLKNADPEQLVDGIRAVAHGHALLAPEVTRRVIAALHPPASGSAPRPAASDAALARLTEREREVLTLAARGLSNAEIARSLYLGEATVKTHVSNCLAKLGVRDRVQAVVRAYEAGLVLPGE